MPIAVSRDFLRRSLPLPSMLADVITAQSDSLPGSGCGAGAADGVTRVLAAPYPSNPWRACEIPVLFKPSSIQRSADIAPHERLLMVSGMHIGNDLSSRMVAKRMKESQ